MIKEESKNFFEWLFEPKPDQTLLVYWRSDPDPDRKPIMVIRHKNYDHDYDPKDEQGK